ncbi:MAG TPA: glutamyl-tRNA reductase [Chitinispirillaceae bacterium]|nr:glutamyl-tRNA reductase [Chitinispirillaceae bacterium]
MLHIGALVTDFRTSSMHMRDKLYLEKERLQLFLDSIPQTSPLYEIVALCTCNRIELYYVCQYHDEAADWLIKYLAQFHDIALPLLQNHLINYRCEDAIDHLFRVASGVESMVFGEHEILGQIRSAYFVCLKNDKTSSYLNRLFQQAISTGKQVRNRTSAARGALSIASIAIERMIELAHDLNDKRILIVGVGTMGLRALKRLISLHPFKIGLSNRTNQRAKRFCDHFNTVYIPFENFADELRNYDIVLLATSSQQYILNTAHVSKRKSQLMIIDLGAPCNADPQLGSMENIKMVCIDDLRTTAIERLDSRKFELSSIEQIIADQVKEFIRWYRFKSRCECKNQ